MNGNGSTTRLSVMLLRISETLARWDAHTAKCKKCLRFQSADDATRTAIIPRGVCVKGRKILRELLEHLL
jgi:hypothetical protein